MYGLLVCQIIIIIEFVSFSEEDKISDPFVLPGNGDPSFSVLAISFLPDNRGLVLQ